MGTGTGWGYASGAPWAAHAWARRIARSWRRIIPEPSSSASTDDQGVRVGAKTMSEPLRVGIVGAGAVVQVAHLPVLKKMKGIEVRALCDNDLPKARALAD